MAMVCPACGEDAPEEAKWCEACGQDLNAEPLPACVECGEREVADEGYCLSCGHKQPEERDHMEFEDGSVWAVTDRGKRHRHNEDSVAIGVAPGGSVVLVVCDGVSSTPGSAEASLRAATAARDVLVDGLGPGPIESTPPPAGPVPTDVGLPTEAEGSGGHAGLPPADAAAPPIATLLSVAIEAAQAEASAAVPGEANSPYAQAGAPPSSTIVAVVATPTPQGADLTTAWVGDSRAYWVGKESMRLSPNDHELSGSLIRWLGADSMDPTPEINSTSVTGPGHVVVCSDGLWRYAAEPSELADLIGRLQAEGHAGLDLASSMVAFANEGGGHDNISVALWSHDPDAGSVNGSAGHAEQVSSEQVSSEQGANEAKESST